MANITSLRIDDDTPVEVNNFNSTDRIVSLFEDINREIDFQTGVDNTDISLETDTKVTNWVYPIEEKMFKDLNYHARSCMYVNMHICPYQVRYGTDNKTPFVQYIMRKRNDKSPNSNLSDHDNNYIGFHSKTYFDHHTTNINFYDEAVKMMKVMMLGYGKITKNVENIVYKGFRKSGNDFYVFFDLSDFWINHHYLNMADPLWLVNMYEMFVLKEVCSVPISEELIGFLEENSDIFDLYYADKTRVSIPVVGYTIEDKSHMDFTMTFGTCSETYKDLQDSFVYYYDYNECCSTIKDEDKSKKVVMRHSIIYDISVDYNDYNDLTDDDKEKRVLILDKVHDKFCGFVVFKHSSQTPLTSHNILHIS